jgi:putative oxidoreductase
MLFAAQSLLCGEKRALGEPMSVEIEASVGWENPADAKLRPSVSEAKTEHSHQFGSIEMSFTENLATTWAPRAEALLRIVSGYLFLLHGSAKLLHMPHIPQFDEVQILSLLGVAGVLELAGGILLILGLFTRPVAFVLSGEMAFAYFMAHATKETVLLPLMNHGEASVLFCFIFLFLAVAGGGVWSIDGLRAKK